MTLRQQGKGERPNDLQFDALKQFYLGKYIYVHAHTQVALQRRGWFEGGRLTQAGRVAYRHECIKRRRKPPPEKMFVLYDGRAKTMNTDDCAILDTADSEIEAVLASMEDWQRIDAIWFEYEHAPSGDPKYQTRLVNEKARPELGRKWLL